MEPPAGRTKRAAASKAEGFFRALASSGASSAAPGGETTTSVVGGETTSVVDSESKKSSRGGTSDSPPSDRRGKGSSVDGSGPSVESSGSGRQGQQQTKRKSGGGGRGANEKGKVKTTGDRPLKSAGRNSSGGGGSGGGGGGGSLPRGQPGMKPRPAATSASVVRVLGRLGEWGVKVRVPTNPTVDDVWKAVDVVLRNLPDTSGLTVDALVGFARLRRSTRKGSPLSIGDGGCGRATTSGAGDSASSRRKGGREEKGRCYSDEAAAANAKAVVAAATAAECAKGRPVPPQKMVEDELAEKEEELLAVEVKATAALQRLATTVEELRYDVNAPEEARWQAWAKETLREYAPLQEKMEEERAAAAAKISKKERIEKKLLKEEAIAVCYICNGGEHFENRTDLQEIVFCERCCVAVHSSCYGFDAEEIHKPEKWYCDFCSHLISQAQEHLDAVIAAASSSSSPPVEAQEGVEATTNGPTAIASGSPGSKTPASKRRKVCAQNHNNPSANEPPLLGAASPAAEPWSAPGVGATTPGGHPAAGGEASPRPPGNVVLGWQTAGARERPAAAAAAVLPGGEGGSGDRLKAAAAEAAAVLPPTSNGSSLRADTERSSGSWGGVPGGGAVGEKAVHPSSPAEHLAKTEVTAAAAAATATTAGQEERNSPPSPPAGGARREERHGTEEMVAAAEAWIGAEASSLKRDAQMATKRSWDDFENDVGTIAKSAAAAALPPTDGGAHHPARRAAHPGGGGGHASGPASASSSPPAAGSRCPSRSPSAGAGSVSAAASCSSSSSSSPGCRPRAAPVGLQVTRRLETVEPPEVAAARAALEKAQELIGVDLPSLDKGPEADCVLCHVPRGAFLRAERGSKLGWCHCLCAFSKGLVIEDRVVKARGFIKGDGTSQCHFCKNKKSGGLIACSHPGCNVSFHPLCGRASGGTAVRGPHLHPRDWTAQCPEHAFSTSVSKGPVVASTGPMPVKEVYTTSRPPPPKKAASSWVRPSPRAVMCDADPVVAGYRSEVKQTYAHTPPGLCPAGKCHQCKRRNRWRAMCTTCEEGICVYCICQQRESPRAVLAALIAHDDARKNGNPRPPNCFTCYKCRGICFCKDCGGAGARAAVLAAVKRAGGASAPAPARRDPTPTSHKKASAHGRPGPVPLAPRPAESGRTDPRLAQSPLASPPKLTKKRLGPAVGIAPASGSDKRPRKEPPGGKGGDGTQQRQRQQQQQHPRQQHQQPSPALTNDSRLYPAGMAASDDPLSTPNRYSSLESVLLSEESSVLFPWMDQPTPAVRAPGAPPENAANTSYSNGGAWDAQFLSPSRGGDRTSPGSEMQQLNGGGGGGAQANGARAEGGYGGPQLHHQQPSIAAAAAAAAVTAAAVTPGKAWRAQGTASPLPVRSASSAGMPAINVSVSTMSSSTAPANSSISSLARGGGAPQSAVSAVATSSGGGGGGGGGVQTAAEAARTALLYYQKAVAEREAARKLTEDVLDAKAFSDRNNKAAMWRVEAATKLKDKLIMANELINGYSDMRRKAHNEAKAASAEEASAVDRYEKARVEAGRLQELAASARATAATATDSPSWSNDSSSNSSTTSSAGGTTTCSTSTERSESPASALTAALAAGMNGTDSYGSNSHAGGGNPMSADHPVSSSSPEASSSRGGQQGFPWAQGAPRGCGLAGENSSAQQQQQQQQQLQQRDHAVPPAGSVSSAGNNVVNGANNRCLSSSFNSNSSPSGGGDHPPTGVLTAMNKPVPLRAGGGGNGSSNGNVNPYSAAATAATEKASRASTEVESLRRAALAASAAVQRKEATVLELANRQKRAEAGRAELVRETQFASDSASKASQAAMHYEKVAQAKKQEETAAFERVSRAQWEAKTASDIARRLAEAERNAGRRRNDDAFFGIDVGGGGGGGAVMPAAAPSLARTSISSNGGGFGDGGGGGGSGGSGGKVMPAAAALARTSISSNGGGFGDGTVIPAVDWSSIGGGFSDGGSGGSGGTVRPAAAAALARTNISSNGSGFGDGGSGVSGGTVRPAAAAALARTNISSNGSGFGDGGGGGSGGTVRPAAAAALARTNISSNGGGFGDGKGGGGGSSSGGTVMPAAAAALARTNITSADGGFGDGGEGHRSGASGESFAWSHGQTGGSSYSNNTGGPHQRRC